MTKVVNPSAIDGRPAMLWGDSEHLGRPFSKDPSVIEFGGRYLMYYSMAPSSHALALPGTPKGWAVGIAESRDLVRWQKVGEMLPLQECEQNGLTSGKAIVLGGKVHQFYNTYGNGRNDALCHAVSDDGLSFVRNPTNPILRPTGDWNSGRAIDCDAFEHDGRLIMLYATRDPTSQTQMLVAAAADLNSDFSRAAWKQICDGPVLQPELSWETQCIEAPSVVRRGDTLFLFYGGGYNNNPQQIGVAKSQDGVHWQRLFDQPLIPNGEPGDWNASETGHPGVFVDRDDRTYLFVQGNNDRGRTWYLSAYEVGWRNDRPYVIWDSDKFPAKRLRSAADREDGDL
jgi:sucrose-6-phosphate hydrolase SacC (GH32 family)